MEEAEPVSLTEDEEDELLGEIAMATWVREKDQAIPIEDCPEFR